MTPEELSQRTYVYPVGGTAMSHEHLWAKGALDDFCVETLACTETLGSFIATLTAERDNLQRERDALILAADERLAESRRALEEVQIRARIMSVPDADCGEEVLRDVFLHIAEALGGKS